MARYAVTSIAELHSIHLDGVDWKPIQHYFQLTAFGINVYCAERSGAELVGEHDETLGLHEEVYMVLDGRVRFRLDDEDVVCSRGSLVVVPDPGVRRKGTAETADAAVLAIGSRQTESFRSTWNPDHFQGVPTYDEQPPDDTA